jgi:hypothetical protein
MTLDLAQARALYEDGYLQVPGLVPRALIEQALRAINASLGHEGIDKERLPVFRASTFTPELCAQEAITAVYAGSPLRALAEAAIGSGQVRTPTRGQIALRFPTLGPAGAPTPHIDGIAYPGNGVPPGTLQHFTALAGVFLSDAPEPDRGNFTVWPGSHHQIAAYLGSHGPASVTGGLPALPFAPPRQLLVAPGDALLAHYQLAHAVAPNTGPHIRYALFFRLEHVTHALADLRPLTEPWRLWAGVRAAGLAR